MRVLVYGGGAVGLGVASCLLKAGAILDLITRADTVRSLLENGLVRTGIFGDFSAKPDLWGFYQPGPGNRPVL